MQMVRSNSAADATGWNNFKTTTALIYQNVFKFALRFLIYVKLTCSSFPSFFSGRLELVLIFARMTHFLCYKFTIVVNLK